MQVFKKLLTPRHHVGCVSLRSPVKGAPSEISRELTNMSAGGRAVNVPRPQRRAAVAANALVPHDFNGVLRASDELGEEIERRIFSPIVSSATSQWIVPEAGLGLPPTIDPDAPMNHEYRYQAMVADEVPIPAIRRPPQRNEMATWDWVRNNVTLFYQSPEGSPFYLRSRMLNGGVTRGDWMRIFPEGGRPENHFRSFHLINISNLAEVPAERNVDNTVYQEIDLVSRAPNNTISIPVDEGDDMNTIANEALQFVSTIVPNFAAVPPQNPTIMASFIYILTSIIHSLARPRVIGNEVMRIILTYEVHSAQNNEVILLSKGTSFIPDPNISEEENLQNLALRLALLLWDIRATLMVERYEENGNFLFHPRSMRVVFTDMPQAGGDVFLDRPVNFYVPRGGCMTVHGMPIALIKLMKDVAVTHDIHLPGAFFDNNCGIREALICLGHPYTTKEEVRQLYTLAAQLRAETPMVPPFIRLSPHELGEVIIGFQGDTDINIYSLPSPQDPNGRVYTNRNDETPPRTFTVNLILSHNHYFGLNWDGDLSTEDYVNDMVLSIRYCKRCARYYRTGVNRVSHDEEQSSNMYPACKERYMDTADRDQFLETLHGSPVKTINTCSAIPAWKLTPNNRIGFMDLETWRPSGAKGYHEVYAVGWVKEADPNIKPEDVVLFSSTSDPDTHNSALVQAFVNLIAWIVAKPTVFDKKKPYYLWLYNGSGFDNLFILHTLVSHFKMKPDNMTLKDGKLMTMSFLDGTLIIRDLCLFTLCSLAKACKTYQVEEHLAKGHFDHNSIVSLDVVADRWGEIAEYLSKDLTALNMVYIKFAQATFDTVHLDPCTRITASHLAYDYWNSTLTHEQRQQIVLPSSYDEFHRILQSYYGGRVFPQVKYWKSMDGHLPYDEMKDYLIDLDVVSLYPSSMSFSQTISANFYTWSGRNIPTYFCGTPTFVTQHEGIEKLLLERTVYRHDEELPSMDYWRALCDTDYRVFNLNEEGAIVCVDVIPPTDLNIPLLPHKNLKGDTSWDLLPKVKQCYIIEELLDAIYYGYKVVGFHYAYIYPIRLPLFDKNIGTLSTLKASMSRDNPGRDITKLLMNGCYGKMVQKPELETMQLIYAHELDDFCRTNHVLAIEPICNTEHAPLLQFIKKNKPTWVNANPQLFAAMEEALTADYEIPVLAFIVTFKPDNVLPTKPTYLGAQVTAYSRVHMNFIMHKMGLLRGTALESQLFYTDTDSLVAHNNACQNLEGVVGKALGQLDDELEGGRIVEFVSLAPKTYCLVYKKKLSNGEEPVYMKIRCKGFPHTKETLLYNTTPCDPTPFFSDGKLDPTKLDLGQRVYVVTMQDDTVSYYLHLNPDIFRGILQGDIKSMVVHFTSMRRCYFGVHALGHVSGIKHCQMHRSLSSAVWWGSENEGVNHRFTDPRYPLLTFPIGFDCNTM